ncbi:hypothetical protein [Agromyces kandeliae]|uniref:Uncharacterized protein n=1 Tax=Agromyces kandeliae TaxID=2666141 RepID=A0A6L5R169_9MICO|nr:hypothetical protein [Agromyces kandeliae]MRX43702.1 hypothetical protein [Agromyces kandeliae]
MTADPGGPRRLVTGTDVGRVAAVGRYELRMLALAAPFVGRTADRFRAHRSIQPTSMVLLVLSAVSLAFARPTASEPECSVHAPPRGSRTARPARAMIPAWRSRGAS